MDLESVKRYLEKGDDVKEEEEEEIQENKITIHELPSQFYERFVMEGIKLDLIECGRIICSFNVSPRLLNGSKILHGGVVATMVDLVGSSVTPTCGALNTGVSVEINVSFMDAVYENEELEIEARALHVGKATAVVSVELRKKKTGKIIGQGRHTIYLATSRL